MSMTNLHSLLLRLVLALILSAFGAGTPAWLSALMPASVGVETLDLLLVEPDALLDESASVGLPPVDEGMDELPPTTDSTVPDQEGPLNEPAPGEILGGAASEAPSGEESVDQSGDPATGGSDTAGGPGEPSGDTTGESDPGGGETPPGGSVEQPQGDGGDTGGERGQDTSNGTQTGTSEQPDQSETGSAVPVEVETSDPKPVEGGMTSVEPGRTFRVEMSPGDAVEIQLAVANLGFPGVASLPDSKEWVRVPPAGSGVDAVLIDPETRTMLGSVDGDAWPETDALDVGEVQVVAAVLEASSDAQPGDYELRYEVRSLGDPRQVVTVRFLVTVRAVEVEDAAVTPTPTEEAG